MSNEKVVKAELRNSSEASEVREEGLTDGI
jgi:hypothetical protein